MIPALIYVAGPFRGKNPLVVRRNVERARDVGLQIAERGAYPIIPHTMTSEFDQLLTDQFWLDGTMEMLRRCDGIFLIQGWEQSRGATAEKAEAVKLGKPDFVHLHELERWLKGRTNGR